MLEQYFDALYAESGRFISGLGLPVQPLGLPELLGTMRPEIGARRASVVTALRKLRIGDTGTGRPPRNAVASAGLNTVGLLSDRLTVLAMKDWVLGARLDSPAKARALRETQVAELVASLAAAQPGHSSFTQKLTPLKVDAAAETWEEAYFGLLSTNVLLWEAQEVLYAGRIDQLECDELRRYIAWFSEGNIARNEFIGKCESMFWSDLMAAGTSPA